MLYEYNIHSFKRRGGEFVLALRSCPENKKGAQGSLFISSGGEGEIRTHGPREGTPVFKTGAINRSATSPEDR